MSSYHAWTHRPKHLGGTDPVESLAVWPIKVFRDDIAVATGNGRFIWLIPEDLDEHQLFKVEAFVTTAGSGATTVQVRKVGTGDMLTTPVTIDSGELNSRDASVQSVVDVSAAEVAWGDHIAIDVDAAGAGALGLGIYFYFLATTDQVSAVSGPQGPQGSTGATGDTGPQGPQGDPGGITDWEGAWAPATSYQESDAVSHNGSSYVAIQAHTSDTDDDEPGVGANWEDYWMLLASGASGAAAEDITYDNTSSGLTADDVQEAIDELSAGGADIWDGTVVKTTTESVAGSTTLQNDDELLFSVTANAAYYFELVLFYDDPTNTADDIKHAFAVASGSFSRGWRQHAGLGPTTAVAQASMVADMTTAIVNASGSETFVVKVHGYFVPSATTTVTFQWAQNTSDANAIRVRAGSVIRWREVA